MKLNLFLLFSFIAFWGVSQNFTQSNEPQVNESLTLYVCDSTFSNFDAIQGDGVTWDFSTITSDDAKTAKILSVETSTDVDFSAATNKTLIPGFLTTYWSSDVSTRSSHGFIFIDNSIGNIDIRFNSDPEKLMDYPFSLNSTLTDSYSGTLYNSTMASSGSDCTGSVTSTIDARGTLILPGNNTFSNVLRHKITETTSSNITFLNFPVSASVTRIQYDYYDLLTSSLPLFSHIRISYSAGMLASGVVTLVMSSIEPGTAVSTASLADVFKNDFKLYPNPAKKSFKLSGDIEIGSSLQIIDPNGREIIALQNIDNSSDIDVSGLLPGVYFVNIKSGKEVLILRIVIE
jgi:hypothetical protein